MTEDSKSPVLLSYAFRPFFVLNGLFAIAVVLGWMLALNGSGLPSMTAWWHAHEMIMGFALAALAGFSLTAVSVWTGRPAIHGTPIALLMFCWLAGRLAMAFGFGLPPVAVLVLDSLFPALLCLLFGREVIAARSQRNYGLVIILAFMAGANVLFHLGLGGQMPGVERVAVYLLIHSMLLLVTIVSGRITPAFTRNWMKQKGLQPLPKTRDWVEKSTLALTILTGLAVALIPFQPATGIVALLTALAHGLRLSAWRGLAITSDPLLFVLHAAYAWLPLGYAMLACSLAGWTVITYASLHILTIGAIGNIVLAVTTRVALGHTGRPLQVSRAIAFAYWLMFVTVLVRLLSNFAGSQALTLIEFAATGWILVFSIFTWVYWPILTRK